MFVQFFYCELVEVNMVNIDIANNVTHPSSKVKFLWTIHLSSRMFLKLLL